MGINSYCLLGDYAIVLLLVEVLKVLFVKMYVNVFFVKLECNEFNSY